MNVDVVNGDVVKNEHFLRFTRAVLAVAFLCAPVPAAEGQTTGKSVAGINSESAAPDCRAVVTVQNERGIAVEGARAIALRWTGEWESLGIEGVTNSAGQVTLAGLPLDTSLAIRVLANDYAAGMRDIEFSKPSHRPLEVIVSPPVSPLIRVLDPNGREIAGAEIHRLEYVDANANARYLTQRTAASLDVQMDPSSDDGVLRLPKLPRASRLKFTVVHPDWKMVELNNLVAAEGEIASVTLQPGTRFRIELVPSEGVPKSLDGLVASVSLYARTPGQSEPASIRHPFTVEDNAIELTVHPRHFSQLGVDMDDYFVTPEFLSTPDGPVEQLDLTSVTSRTIRLDVRQKISLTGKVVDRNGDALKGVSLWGAIDSYSEIWPEAEPDPNAVETDASRIAKLRQKWASGGNAETDRDGRYEIELAPGQVHLEPYFVGYFSEPHVIEFEVAEDGSGEVPTITLLEVPTLRGKVVDQEGEGVGGMLVRMRSLGRGDAEPLDVSKSDGSFELTMSRIPYRMDGHGLLKSVFVMAFDPKGNRAGISEVRVADAEAVNSISIELEARDSQWVLQPLKDREPEEPVWQAALERELAQNRDAYPSGLPGKDVPELSAGTWMNTTARSLKDFRGKYVLLDFWFIGCGPCHRDMPSIKMAQKMFGDQAFTVVSIHRTGQTPESVRQFVESNEMDYPIVVDDAEGTITEAYRELGVSSYPSYILLGPDGKIVHNDHVSLPPSLRRYKLEMIYHSLHPSLNHR